MVVANIIVNYHVHRSCVELRESERTMSDVLAEIWLIADIELDLEGVGLRHWVCGARSRVNVACDLALESLIGCCFIYCVDLNWILSSSG